MAKKYTIEVFDATDPNAECVDAIHELIQNIRPQDKEDLEAVGGDACFNVIKSVRLSEVVYICRGEKGELLCLLGKGPISFEAPGRSVWMLGTNAIEAGGYVKDVLFRGARKVIGEWADQHGLLHNIVYAKNERSMAYLTRLGARWLPEKIKCTDGTEWCQFYIPGKGR